MDNCASRRSPSDPTTTTRITGWSDVANRGPTKEGESDGARRVGGSKGDAYNGVPEPDQNGITGSTPVLNVPPMTLGCVALYTLGSWSVSCGPAASTEGRMSPTANDPPSGTSSVHGRSPIDSSTRTAAPQGRATAGHASRLLDLRSCLLREAAGEVHRDRLHPRRIPTSSPGGRRVSARDLPSGRGNRRFAPARAPET